MDPKTLARIVLDLALLHPDILDKLSCDLEELREVDEPAAVIVAYAQSLITEE